MGVVLGIVFLGGYFLHDLLADAQNFVVFLCVELPVLVLVLVILGASSIARESDRGSLDLLLLTPLSPASYWLARCGVWFAPRADIGLVVLTMLLGGLATLHEQALIVLDTDARADAGVLHRRLHAHHGRGPPHHDRDDRSADTARLLRRSSHLTHFPEYCARAGNARHRISRCNSLVGIPSTGAARVVSHSHLACSIHSITLSPNRLLYGRWSENELTPNYAYQYRLEFEGPWTAINYGFVGSSARLYDRFNYTSSYQQMTALQFGFAQTVAAIWLFSFALKNIDFMLGRPFQACDDICERWKRSRNSISLEALIGQAACHWPIACANTPNRRANSQSLPIVNTALRVAYGSNRYRLKLQRDLQTLKTAKADFRRDYDETSKETTNEVRSNSNDIPFVVSFDSSWSLLKSALPS